MRTLRDTQTILLVALLGLVAAFQSSPAIAQSGRSVDDLLGGSGSPAVVASPVESDLSAPVTVSAAADRTAVARGQTIVFAVVLDHSDGWHSWPSQDQDVLPEVIAQFAIRTAINFTGDAPWIGSRGSIQWPEPHPAPVPDLEDGIGTMNVPTYSGRAIAYVPVFIADDAPLGSVEANITVSLQSCDDTQCLMPEDIEATVQFTIVASDEESSAPIRAGDFATFDPAILDDMKSGGGASGSGTTSDSDGAMMDGAADRGSTPSIFGLSLSDPSGLLGLVLLLIASAVGGFVLNLTPCVLPVIPIKIMTLTQHAGKHSESGGSSAIALGFWMALGVVVFWFALGVPVAIFREAFGDPSRFIFGNWWVSLGIGGMIALMGLGIMGMFQFRLPQATYMFNPDPNRPWGSFLFGVMTAILGLPCFGFVAGGLLAGVAALPTVAILAIFLGLGIGMAAPYLVLSAKPGLLSKIPKTGPASELVKQVMGLLLFAAAAFFGAVGLYALVADHPWIAKNLKWWVSVFFVLLAVMWLSLRTWQITSKPAARIALPVAGLLVVLGFSWFAFASSHKDLETWRLAGGLPESEYITDAWIEYTHERFENARADGKIVVIDFTAEWCINCKVYKSAVLDREPVLSRLMTDDVVCLEADLTSKLAPGNRLMNELGQTGIPLLVVYGPALDEPLMSNSAAGSVVLDMVAQAGGESG